MKNFIIYGAAAIGNIAKNSLEKCGGTILGYIDKRAFELGTYNQLPVWDIDNVPEKYINEEITIFLGVKNVFEHESIVKLLMKRGFKYIIYKPYNLLIGHGTEQEEYIAGIYDMIFEASPGALSMKLPMCVVDADETLNDYAIIKSSDTEVIAYIPAEFIYTNNYLQGGMVKWGNINILSLFTHIDFFRFLDNREKAYPQAYLEEYCEYTAKLQKTIKITDAWKDNVITNRKQIYEKMNENINLDFEFFIRNAPDAIWNAERHVFNLTSGKHRSAFLGAKGMKYIPLKISKKDYERFYHKEEAVKVKKLLACIERDVVIPHPCFYRDFRNSDKDMGNFLPWFARYYGRKTYYEYGQVMFQNMKIMDWSDDSGNFARFAIRLGCNVNRFVRATKLEKQLNELFYTTVSYEEWEDCERKEYDVCVIEGYNTQNILLYMQYYKNIIIKYCTEEQVMNICDVFGLKIKEKICERYEKLEMKGIYLLST